MPPRRITDSRRQSAPVWRRFAGDNPPLPGPPEGASSLPRARSKILDTIATLPMIFDYIEGLLIVPISRQRLRETLINSGWVYWTLKIWAVIRISEVRK